MAVAVPNVKVDTTFQTQEQPVNCYCLTLISETKSMHKKRSHWGGKKGLLSTWPIQRGALLASQSQGKLLDNWKKVSQKAKHMMFHTVRQPDLESCKVRLEAWMQEAVSTWPLTSNQSLMHSIWMTKVRRQVNIFSELVLFKSGSNILFQHANNVIFLSPEKENTTFAQMLERLFVVLVPCLFLKN